MDNNREDRKVFVSLKNRDIKAKKIEAVLAACLSVGTVERRHILDIGCGNGQISEYLAQSNSVVGVDVEDHRDVLHKTVYKFVKLSSSTLPFENQTFDIVITNHVIEHLGEQRKHLTEIFRVLKQGGVCYLATPNWNFPVEPHYKIPLIHYLSPRLFHSVLRMFGRYKEDLFLLSYRRMFRLFREHKFEVTEYTVTILKNPKQYHLGVTFTQYFPGILLEMMKPVSPTNIFILRKHQ